MERFGREMFSRKREEYIALARDTFAEDMNGTLVDDLAGRIAVSPDAGDVAALKGDLDWLSRSRGLDGARREGEGK